MKTQRKYTEADCDCRSYGESSTCPFHGTPREEPTTAAQHTPLHNQGIEKVIRNCPGLTSNEKDEIVRAVNAHEELVKALKLVDEFLANGTALHPGSLISDEGDISARDYIAQAIAKAEGK